jgi:hypothetical protein
MTVEESADRPIRCRSQEYYWTSCWQEGERESLEAQARGETVTFDGEDPNDIIRWLLEPRSH